MQWSRRPLGPPLVLLLLLLGSACASRSPAARADSTTGAARDTAAAPPPGDPRILEQYGATYGFRLGRPVHVTVTPAGEAVLFLRSGPRSFVQDLHEFDTRTGKERVLLTAAGILQGAEERLTPEERARRERLRMQARGIASFQLSEDGRRILVPLSGRLFVIERASGAVRELAGGAGFPIDARFSPDGERVACVRDGDLHVLEVAGGVERRLTRGANDTLSNGTAEFVAQEEMGRFEGYWWSPDGKWIAYQQTNVAGVERFHLGNPARPERPPDEWPYPRAGRKNATVRLGVMPAAGGATTWIEWDHERYPYLCAVRWERNAPLTLLVMDRDQTEELLLAADAATGATTTLLVERDPAWLNLDPEMPKWLADGRSFLWTTERRGTWQLELRARDGRLLRTLNPTALGLRKFLHLDEPAQVAWVVAGEEPTEEQLYRLPLDPGKGRPTRITTGAVLHGAVFGRGNEAYVHTVDALSGERRQEVVSRGGRVLGALRSVAETPPLPPQVELVRLGGARDLRAAIIRPQRLDPRRRYPVVVYVYGGPHTQMVEAVRSRYLLPQWIADHGFIVVSVDGRGTPARGRAWERAIRGDLIGPALDDQVAGLEALGARFPELDLTRVGIYGWSFGGYFSTLAVMKRPDVFHAAVAGAPVADWRDYDTFYTERYLGLPAEHGEDYDRCSALTWAGNLTRPLLLVHGTVDDNVYFMHSIKLADALFRAGREFEFLPLSGFTHAVPDPLVTTRLYTRIVEFFRHRLGGPVPQEASQ